MAVEVYIEVDGARMPRTTTSYDDFTPNARRRVKSLRSQGYTVVVQDYYILGKNKYIMDRRIFR